MPLTVLMLAVLIASFALMFGLVKFTERIIDRVQTLPVQGDGAAAARDTVTETV